MNTLLKFKEFLMEQQQKRGLYGNYGTKSSPFVEVRIEGGCPTCGPDYEEYVDIDLLYAEIDKFSEEFKS